MPRPLSVLIVALVLHAVLAVPVMAQGSARTIRILVNGDPAILVPGWTPNTDEQRIGEVLFLRLAGYAGTTSGDRSGTPALARGWTRRDPLTLVFELDSRARWHDGKPVTMDDVLYSFERARDVKVSPGTAPLLRQITDVRAEDSKRLVVRFAEPYGEQLYDATNFVPILPAHLLRSLPQDSLISSAFARNPIGSGPYRFVRREPGQFVELAAVPNHFLGKPAIPRVIFLVATDQEARVNLLLGGGADVMTEFIPPLGNLQRLNGRTDLATLKVPTYSVVYLLFNQRARSDRTAPHPILADPDVRRALTLATDRPTIVQAVYGGYAELASAPISLASWVRTAMPPQTPYDSAEARRILAARGWIDRDGDGILDKDGRPLSLSLSYPINSAPRTSVAAIVQQQWKRLGIEATLAGAEGATWGDRRRKGDFDVDISSATQDPSPSGLVQSWSCAGLTGSNVGSYCNPEVDSLIARARRAGGDSRGAWGAVLSTIASDYPAVFLYQIQSVIAYRPAAARPDVRPESYWSQLPRWQPGGGQ